jgi:hypothetical protein
MPIVLELIQIRDSAILKIKCINNSLNNNSLSDMEIICLINNSIILISSNNKIILMEDNNNNNIIRETFER